jgi:hypothetical protein
VVEENRIGLYALSVEDAGGQEDHLNPKRGLQDDRTTDNRTKSEVRSHEWKPICLLGGAGTGASNGNNFL